MLTVFPYITIPTAKARTFMVNVFQSRNGERRYGSPFITYRYSHEEAKYVASFGYKPLYRIHIFRKDIP